MENLIRGASRFNQTASAEAKAAFARLASDGQRPDTLLITCVDSRVTPAILGETPGSVLTLRNIGNLVPNPEDAASAGDTSVASTVSFAVEALGVRHIVVMGHSECGGMAELYARRNDFRTDALGAWLQNGRRALQRMQTDELSGLGLTEGNRLSQLSVLAGLEALAKHAAVRKGLDLMNLTLHGWWFDIGAAQVLAYETRAARFIPVERAYESTLAETRR